MSTAIYYFSGTGNSLVVARDIAGKIKSDLIPIPSVMNKNTHPTSADRIGFVFPVYLGGVPRIVRRFVKKMDNLASKYMFAVCTFENTTGVFKILSKEIRKRGGALSASFTVKMPGNYIVGGGAISTSEQRMLFDGWKEKLPVVVKYLEERSEGLFEKFSDTESWLGNLILSSIVVNNILSRMYLSRDRYFYMNENCNGCGICEKVCPVNNIRMTDNRPSWLHRCEQCYACLQWCPKQAIQYNIHPPFIRPGGPGANMTEYRARYHHPDVKLLDITGQKGETR
ncbi:EFR1 family ferrodoxin [candidate division WOR-3 bacterium]|nr:EFR1 family ferrodoxin [candidate division WOR-3 bacterium]